MKTVRAKRKILIVDDDRIFAETVKDYLSAEDVSVLTAHTGAEGLSLSRQGDFDVVLLDQRLPDAEGHTLCQSLLRDNDQAKIIFITAHASFDGAVKAIKAGAFNYLSKPFELEELDLAIRQAMRTLELEKLEQVSRYRMRKEGEEAVIIGENGGLAGIAEMVESASRSDAPVLITGETGAGKNVVAKAIHYRGRLADAPFISINCAALPENLIEAELFGYEKGAFTGAVSSKKSVFEMAHGGTLFLDEIGEMPLHLQAKLLGVLEDKKVRRLGGETEKSVSVRIIAATGMDLEKVLGKKFRKDLYFRLSVVRIHIPPLRERKQDIPALCAYLLRQIPNGKDAVLPESELEKLARYSWPGNVRELKNVLERAVILQKGTLKPSELLCPMYAEGPSENTAPSHLAPDSASIQPLAEIEKIHISRSLTQLSGNLSKTARALGISLSTLKRKLREYGLK